MALKRLEPCAGKLACTVLRGANCSNAVCLLGDINWVAQVSKPFSYIDQSSNKKEGIAIDLLNSIFKKLGSVKTGQDINFEIYARGFLEIETKVNSAFFPIARFQDVESRFKWLGPIVRYKPVLFAKKSKNIKIITPDNLKKYNIGAKTKTGPHKMLIALGLDNSTLTTVPSDEENIKKLNADRIDIVACGDLAGFAIIKSLGYNLTDYEIVYRLKESDLAIAFHKDVSDDMINNLQKTFDEMKVSKNGQPSEYDVILKRYQ